MEGGAGQDWGPPRITPPSHPHLWSSLGFFSSLLPPHTNILKNIIQVKDHRSYTHTISLAVPAPAAHHPEPTSIAMETIRNVATAASQAIVGGGQSDAQKTAEQQSGTEPVSGVKGSGTTEDPYDAGNNDGDLPSDDPSRSSVWSMLTRGTHR